MKNINMVLPSNFKLDDLNNSETLINIIEASIINLIEREINKKAIDLIDWYFDFLFTGLNFQSQCTRRSKTDSGHWTITLGCPK